MNHDALRYNVKPARGIREHRNKRDKTHMDQYEEITQVEITYDEVHGPVYYIVAVLSFISIILSIYLWLFQISAIIYR